MVTFRGLEASAPGCHSLPIATDNGLVSNWRAGDPQAAEELFKRYVDRMRALVASRLRGPMAARLSPDDIVQSVFRTFFEGVAERAYSAPEGRELWGLLCVLALNKVRERVAYHQAARRDVRRTLGTIDSLADAEADTRLMSVEVDDLLSRFRPDDREVIHLRMTGYEITEIADQTSRSLRTIERVLQRARARLAAELS
ncbi:MAG TPA: sigma-70 family RNA polymerase sigma factor [Gemmataceae bacterium]|jgi:RNA polymerase sigma-70 factor (ECF subfamily)|nr:sigma-70 family RNA polymerase sigma factor [Gemmataceae bacterium]